MQAIADDQSVLPSSAEGDKSHWPIASISEKGIRTVEGMKHHFDAIAAAVNQNFVLEVRADVQAQYNEELQRRLTMTT